MKVRTNFFRLKAIIAIVLPMIAFGQQPSSADKSVVDVDIGPAKSHGILAQTGVTQRIAAECPVVAARATQYFEEHNFYSKKRIDSAGIVLDLGNRKDALTPSAKPLSLNRSSIHKYTLPRHLSPFKSYANFRLEGHLKLVKTTEGGCNATLLFEFSAYEWVSVLAVIDDGYRSQFVSNGTLERLYLDAIAALFTKSRVESPRKLSLGSGLVSTDVNLQLGSRP